jgi:hypothetical protein
VCISVQRSQKKLKRTFQKVYIKSIKDHRPTSRPDAKSRRAKFATSKGCRGNGNKINAGRFAPATNASTFLLSHCSATIHDSLQSARCHDRRKALDDRHFPSFLHSSNRLQSIGSSQTMHPPEFLQAHLPQPIAISVLNVAGPVDESNFFEWECYISGPEGTPFEGGVFPATLSFPKVVSPPSSFPG